MHLVEFLSDRWIAALDEAARSHAPTDGGPSLTIDHVVVDGPTWRLVVDRGALSVVAEPTGEPDIRLTSDRQTAAAIASGRRAALDAFVAGELRIGGDVRVLIDHRSALEVLGDVFATVRDATDFT